MQTGKANYRLAARLRGNELLLDADLRKAVEEEHLRGRPQGGGAEMLRRPARLCRKRGVGAGSGDFFLRVGRARRPCGLTGTRRSPASTATITTTGPRCFPAGSCGFRFLRMAETAAACCAGDARLRAMLADDPLFREGYPLLKAGV